MPSRIKIENGVEEVVSLQFMYHHIGSGPARSRQVHSVLGFLRNHQNGVTS